jgi:putative PIN family toxin of toxin-antitoxin system
MRVVLDTNVLISAVLSVQGAPAHVIAAWEQERFEVVVSALLLAEYTRVLTYPKIARVHGMDAGEQQAFLTGFRTAAILVPVTDIPSIIQEDPADNVVLATAVSGEAAYIVSGDQDLLRLSRYQGIEILPPALFLSVLTES